MRVYYDIAVLGISTLHPLARTGIFRVVENVAKWLLNQQGIAVTFVTSQPNIKECQSVLSQSDEFQNVRLISLSRAIKELAILSLMPRFLVGLVVYHSPFHAIPGSVRRWRHIRQVLTIYDLIPILHPEWFEHKGEHYIKRLIDSLSGCETIVCISEATRQDFLSYRGDFRPEQVFVSHLAAGPEFEIEVNEAARREVLLKYEVPTDAPYVLGLSTIEPRKNIEALVKAFGKCIADEVCAELHLVLVGPEGWLMEDVMESIAQLNGLRARVIRTGFVPDEDLPALLSGALCFGYMSRYEGFGLPPLEAMKCGVPVICSNNSSLPEVVGDAGIMLPCDDVDGIASAICHICRDESHRAALGRNGRRRSQSFTWERTAQMTVRAYKGIA